MLVKIQIDYGLQIICTFIIFWYTRNTDRYKAGIESNTNRSFMSLEYYHALHYVVQTFDLLNTYHIKLEKLTNLCVSNLKAQNFYDG